MTQRNTESIAGFAPMVAMTLALAVALGLPAPTRGQDPPAEPILRIDAGMHTAPIQSVGVDAAGRYLVTGSHDKSVRVWELPGGRLLRTIRPPIGERQEGRIFAVALSPDGETVACGGWTKAGGPKHNIYLLDRASGRLTRRIAGLPNVVLDLAFSADGALLAASLGGKNGVRVFRTADGSLAGEDREYGGSSYGVAFSRDGRLVTTSYDGLLRLYDRELRLVAKQKAPGGSRPHAVAFSPDGAKIVVGFFDSTEVDVLSGRDLSHLFSPDTTGVANGYLSSVAWSADGRSLYAGGRWDVAGKYPVRRWSEAGRGAFMDLAAASDTILDLQAIPGGAIVFSAADPAFGIFDARGELALFEGPPDRRLSNGLGTGFGSRRTARR